MRLGLLLLVPLSLFAAVDGTVMNVTKSAAASGVEVNLVQPGEGGMQALGKVNTDAGGKFRFDKEVTGAALLQVIYKDTTYTTVLQPGAPTTGLQVSVYDTTDAARASVLQQHIILLEPSESQLGVSETWILSNTTNTTFSDAAKGTVQVYVPGPLQDISADIEVTGGMPIKRPFVPAGAAGMYKLAYPIKPGETRIDVSYTLPAAKEYEGKLLRTDGPTRLITPVAVTLTADVLKSLGQEPRTQARIYEVERTKLGEKFKVAIEGTGSLQQAQQQGKEEDNGAPQAEVINARIYERVYWVMGLAFGILAMVGTVLYRRGA